MLNKVCLRLASRALVIDSCHIGSASVARIADRDDDHQFEQCIACLARHSFSQACAYLTWTTACSVATGPAGVASSCRRLHGHSGIALGHGLEEQHRQHGRQPRPTLPSIVSTTCIFRSACGDGRSTWPRTPKLDEVGIIGHRRQHLSRESLPSPSHRTIPPHRCGHQRVEHHRRGESRHPDCLWRGLGCPAFAAGSVGIIDAAGGAQSRYLLKPLHREPGPQGGGWRRRRLKGLELSSRLTEAH
jgi:hypothetical protein